MLRIEGANVLPFTANSLNIFVTAVTSSLPNVTASDIIIGPVRTRCSVAVRAGSQSGLPGVFAVLKPFRFARIRGLSCELQCATGQTLHGSGYELPNVTAGDIIIGPVRTHPPMAAKAGPRNIPFE